MLDKVVVYGGPGFLKKVQELRPSLRVMPEAENAGTLQKLVTDLHPGVVAFDESDFKEDIIGVAQKARADIFVDRLWNQDQLANWQDAVNRGAAGIQTDHPAAVVEYLRSKGLHK